MKFDLIISNPPYNNGKDKSYYVKFIEVAYNNCKENGKICFINPHAWIKNNRNIFKKMLTLGSFIHIEQINLNKTFGISIGSIGSLFLYQNINHEDKNYFIILLPEYKIDNIDKIILDKILPKLSCGISGKGANKNEHNPNGFIENKNDLYKYLVYLSSKKLRKSMWSKIKEKGYGLSKLVVSHILDPNNVEHYIEFSINKGVGTYSYYFECTEALANNIITWFKSPIYQYLDSVKRKGRYAFIQSPIINDNNIDNEYLYNYFELTEEERQHIENKIK